MTDPSPIQNQAPVAPRRDHQTTHHGITLNDPYAWLRDKNYPDISDPEILNHLKAENAWFDAQMAPLKPLVEELFSELKGRQPEDDSSVPYRDKGYMYQWRFAEGAQYRTWWRWPVNQPDAAQCFLDEPKLAENQEFFRLGGLSISPDGRYLAYAVDDNGSERYSIRILDLVADEQFDERIENTGGSVSWAADSQRFFYTQLSEQWRPYLVKCHRINTNPDQDLDIYTEKDDSFFVGVSETQSEQWIVITSGDHVTSELRILPSDNAGAAPILIAPREPNREYDLDHSGEYFYLLTNDTHKNFRLARTKVTTQLASPGSDHWETLIKGTDTNYLTDFVCFSNLLVVEERQQGLDQIRLIDLTQDLTHDVANALDKATHYIEFPEPTYSVSVSTNAEPECAQLRIAYNSMVTPTTIWDYDLAGRELLTRKVQEIPSGYLSDLYSCERRLIEARDGVFVPVSLVHRKDTPLNANTPLYLYGYGAYGSAIPPGFSTTRLSLLDRGFVYAIAHIRGGDDLGYHWYEAGKLEHRTNTFNDFVDVARGLIEQGLSSAGRIAIAGGSAGGELMGAVVNQAPEIWGAVVSHVPFVDVLNTMLDGDLPLTPMEWPEWGNPILDKEAFEHILSYSPYDQLQAIDYPPMLVTAGLQDPRVTYWEPAKYVARVRELKTDSNRLLFKTNMGAGHAGKSGRFEALRETAEEYAFVVRELSGSL